MARKMDNAAAAHAAVAQAVKAGRMPEPDHCEACGVEGLDRCPERRSYVWHHFSVDPAHWLHVIALCRTCHGKVHNGSIPEPRTGRLYAPKPKGAGIDDYAVWRAVRRGASEVVGLTADQFALCRERLDRAGVLVVEGEDHAKWRIHLWHAAHPGGDSRIRAHWRGKRHELTPEQKARRDAAIARLLPTATPEA